MACNRSNMDNVAPRPVVCVNSRQIASTNWSDLHSWEGTRMSTATSAATPSAARSQLGSMAIIGALFFIFGFVTWLNGPLITFAQLAFELDEVNAFLILTAFFLSYFFLAIPSSWILKRTGMKKGLALGLLVMAIGGRCSASSARSAGIQAHWAGCS